MKCMKHAGIVLVLMAGCGEDSQDPCLRRTGLTVADFERPSDCETDFTIRVERFIDCTGQPTDITAEEWCRQHRTCEPGEESTALDPCMEINPECWDSWASDACEELRGEHPCALFNTGQVFHNHCEG